jgi:hypothetical protein
VVVDSRLVGGAAHAPRINAVRINRRVLFIGPGLLKKIKKASAFYAKRGR